MDISTETQNTTGATDFAPRGWAGTVISAGIFLLPAVACLPMMSLRLQYFLVFRDIVCFIICGIMAVAMIAEWTAGRMRPVFSAAHYPLALFCLMSAIQIIFCQDRAAGVHRTLMYLCWLIIAAAGARVFSSRKFFSNFVMALSMITAFVCACGILERMNIFPGFIIDYATTRKIGSLLGYSTFYAGYLICVFFLIEAGLFAAENIYERVYYCVILAGVAVNLYMCGLLAASAAVVIGQAAAAALIMAGGSNGDRRGFRSASAAMAVVLLAGSSILFFAYGRNIYGGSMAPRIKSVNKKAASCRVAVRIAADAPFSGAGPGQYPVMYPKYRAEAGMKKSAAELNSKIEVPVTTDNLLYMILAEHGATGLLLLAGALAFFMILPFKRLKKLPAGRKPVEIALVTGFLAIIIFSMFHFPFHTPGVWPVVWILAAAGLALTGGADTRSQKEKSSAPVRLSPARPAAAAILASATLYSLVYIPAGMFVNDLKLSSGVRLAASGDTAGARRVFDSTVPMVPVTWLYYYTYGTAMSSIAPETAAGQFAKAFHLRPYSLPTLSAVIALSEDNEIDPRDLREAKNNYRLLIETENPRGR